MNWELFPEKRIEIQIITNINVKSLNFNYLEMYFNWRDLPSGSRKNPNRIEVDNRLKFNDFIIDEDVEIDIFTIIKIIGFIVIIILGIIKILGIIN